MRKAFHVRDKYYSFTINLVKVKKSQLREKNSLPLVQKYSSFNKGIVVLVESVSTSK
jgi:hypothetical protein